MSETDLTKSALNLRLFLKITQDTYKEKVLHKSIQWFIDRLCMVCRSKLKLAYLMFVSAVFDKSDSFEFLEIHSFLLNFASLSLFRSMISAV